MRKNTIPLHIWRLSLINLSFTFVLGMLFLIWLFILQSQLVSKTNISGELALQILIIISLLYFISMNLVARRISKAIAELTIVVEKTTAQNFSAQYMEEFHSPYIELSIIKKTFLNKIYQLNQQLDILNSLFHLQELMQTDIPEDEFIHTCRLIYQKYFQLNLKEYDKNSDALIFQEKTIYFTENKQQKNHLPLLYTTEKQTEPFDQTIRFFYHKNLLQEDFLSAIEKNHEFQMGHQVQEKLLPRIPKALETWQISFFVRSALHFGGDFLDLPIINDKPCFLIADVSGKGLPAALFAATIKSWFTAFSSIHFALDKILEKINNALIELKQPSFFCTFFACGYDQSRKILYYCSAGHNRMLLMHHGELLQLNGDSLPLGIMKDEIFQTSEIAISDGDLLFLYTDGVTEAEASCGAMFGHQRLNEFLIAHAHKNADELQKLLNTELEIFTGNCPQSDDITFLFVRF